MECQLCSYSECRSLIQSLLWHWALGYPHIQTAPSQIVRESLGLGTVQEQVPGCCLLYPCWLHCCLRSWCHSWLMQMLWQHFRHLQSVELSSRAELYTAIALPKCFRRQYLETLPQTPFRHQRELETREYFRPLYSLSISAETEAWNALTHPQKL